MSNASGHRFAFSQFLSVARTTNSCVEISITYVCNAGASRDCFLGPSAEGRADGGGGEDRASLCVYLCLSGLM